MPAYPLQDKSMEIDDHLRMKSEDGLKNLMNEAVPRTLLAAFASRTGDHQKNGLRWLLFDRSRHHQLGPSQKAFKSDQGAGPALGHLLLMLYT